MTDNQMEEHLAKRCRELLLVAAGSIPIVSVSQKPISFGENVCVGEIGRSGLNMDRQTYAGLERIDTKWVAFAEHDCIYSPEHFAWTPPDDESFFYNDNAWLCQYRNPKYPEWDGMFSYIKRRRVQSQLICSTELLREATARKIEILGHPAWMEHRGARAIGEPGSADYRRTMRLARRAPLQPIWRDLKDYITMYAAKDFRTTVPNIDIRHGENFTGPRRGKMRRFELEPWGTLTAVLNG